VQHVAVAASMHALPGPQPYVETVGRVANSGHAAAIGVAYNSQALVRCVSANWLIPVTLEGGISTTDTVVGTKPQVLRISVEVSKEKIWH
jgi:hypothetical protein